MNLAAFRVYWRVLALLGPERRLVTVLCLGNVGVAALAFLEPMLFGKVIDVLSSAGGQPGARWDETLRLLGAWAGVGVVGIVATILVALHSDRLAHRRRLAAIADGFDEVLDLPFAFHSETHSARLLKVLLQGADNLFNLWLSFFREHLSTFIGLVVLLPASLFLNWRLGLLLIGLIVVFAVLAYFVVGKTEAAQARVEEEHSALAGRLGDVLGNVPLVQSFARLAEERRALAIAIERVKAAQFPVLDWWATVTVLSRLAATVTLLAIFLIGAWANAHGEATVGEIVTFMGFATMLIGKLDAAMGFLSRLSLQAQAIREFLELFDLPSTVSDKPGAIDLPPVTGRVEFDQVSFSYPNRLPSLRGVSFVAEPGTVVALVGPSGAGKTTTMSLLHRVFDPTEGHIRIDGHDIADVTLASLRRNIAVVFQEARLLNRTIAENLMLAKPDATLEEMEAAARLARVDKVIASQPKGYDSAIGERGVRLSGGERQRLQIARAALKAAPILVLDEATSALDTVTEAEVQRALNALMKGRTTFVIAHRLSTIRHADQILVLKDGEIVERGTYDELLVREGLFAELVATQRLAQAAAEAERTETA
ncbi:MAG: glucan ABC transporter ATP-binding protein/ permease [Alphaproteobacteria bacterium]|jgi:ATP-binding cassette subfamily B protein|nr:glucan ABC transporter ATP-binding protein/ permease [Alphaproteobacteria bacterium]